MFKIPFFGDRQESKTDEQQTAIDQHQLERRQFESVLKSFKAGRIKERLLILDAFLAVEKHVTLSELEMKISEQHPELHDRAFILETMEMFCRFGFASKVTFESQDTRYEHQHLGTHHDHFICTRCGIIQEFVNPEIERMQLEIAQKFRFHPLQHKMEIYGLCSSCMEQRESTLPLLYAANGEQVMIVEIVGGRSVKARLSDMGLVEGVCIDVINNQATGPFIVAVKGTRLALSSDIAGKILVSHSCRHSKLKREYL